MFLVPHLLDLYLVLPHDNLGQSLLHLTLLSSCPSQLPLNALNLLNRPQFATNHFVSSSPSVLLLRIDKLPYPLSPLPQLQIVVAVFFQMFLELVVVICDYLQFFLG